MSQTEEKQTAISPDIQENEEQLKERLGFDVSFDAGVRKITVFDKELQIYFVNGLCDNLYIIEILRELMLLDSGGLKSEVDDFKQTIINHLPHVQVEYVDTLEDVATQMLSGLISILVEGEKQAIVIDVRNYPGRGPEEPDTERVVRGARDGYTENIIMNTGLTRRRIRDERLRNEIMKVGTRSKTDICISYIDGIADPDLVAIVKKELEAIKIDGIAMADKIVEEYIVKQRMNPFPLVRYTERPDVAADHLLEGHIVIMVDTSPSVIITPTTLFHHVQHAEEYRQAPMIGTILRWTRFIGIMFSLLILPFWLLLVMQPSLLPAGLDFIGPEQPNHIPIVVQILFAELGIELLRMAAVHTPSPLATALGIVAAILIGELAVEVGYFTSEVILYIALGAIGMFATPSYELGLALRVVRVLLIISVAFFKAPGFVIGLTIFILALTLLKTLNKPYLWPFLPFDPPALWHIIIRSTVPSLRFRPSIVHPQNVTKQRAE
ncbi:spore germination protein [Bacillus sp. JCM 19034]|uniref:spore germination protein n=1 Tax=Bacillus sp. JCM 19034 TaxID=1481928 RepID=UPI0007839725|nr:spore germination protein [Bacillus sp. JCM 19034]